MLGHLAQTILIDPIPGKRPTILYGRGYVDVRTGGRVIRVGIHGPHHPFLVIGKAPHIQVNIWKPGVPGSGRVVRVPIPGRKK